ncbi:MAG: 4Fe-4S binding protein, partial [Bacteroidales bacterium]|nr:4Fe-4S binding protein [Bacteroidales bacterium]
CVNKDRGPAVKKACANACIGCGICAKTCTHEAIVFENNVAYIDYAKCKLCRECEAVCPTGAIHGVNYPKPLDVEGIKARIAARKAAAAATPAEGASSSQVTKENAHQGQPSAAVEGKNENKKEE